MFYHSRGGGTGSGIATVLLERLNSYYPKKKHLIFSIQASPKFSSGVVEPYNAVLGSARLLEYCDGVNIWMDNESLFNICSKDLKIANPNFKNINRLIAKYVSSVTAPLRFGGSLNETLSEM